MYIFNMKIIETKYKGYNFRSRTEARWAVYFDSLGWKYEYEPEGFVLKSGAYLPDFFFPDLNIYAEIKGKKFTEIELNKCYDLSNESGCIVLMLDGQPDIRQYEYIYPNNNYTDHFVFIEKGEKYYPMYMTGGEFYEYYVNIKHVNKSRSKRFEFL